MEERKGGREKLPYTLKNPSEAFDSCLNHGLGNFHRSKISIAFAMGSLSRPLSTHLISVDPIWSFDRIRRWICTDSNEVAFHSDFRAFGRIVTSKALFPHMISHGFPFNPTYGMGLVIH